MSQRSRLAFYIYTILPAVTAAWFGFTLPSDGQNALLWGLSRSRLSVAGILFLVAVIFTGLTFYVITHWDSTQRWLAGKLNSKSFRNILIVAFTLLIATAGIILNIPDKYLGESFAVIDRIRPALNWIFLTSLQLLSGIIFFEFAKQSKVLSKWNKNLLPTGIVLGALLIVWLFVALTGLGLNSANAFWSKNGVPILWPQISLALGIGLAVSLFLDKKAEKFRWFDVLMVALLWMAAVILWNKQPYQQGVFNTPPRPPTYEVYPINDSLIFDVGAQKLLIGQRMIADVVDKPVFVSFLAMIHFFAGSSYAWFYLFQIMFFAFIPVIGYFIGKTIHSRALGSMFAVLLTIKELNAITLTNYIHVSTSKMILSEMLTTFGLLLFIYFLMKWIKSAELWDPNLYLAGGILGITSLVRLNSIGVLPFAIMLIVFSSKFKWKKWIIASLILTSFLVISALPWLLRTTVISGDPFNFISSKTSGVIGNQRYDPIIKSTQSAQPQSPKQSSIILLGQGIINNYLHNLIGITIMLPPTFQLFNLLDLVRLPYWKLEWTGLLLAGGFWIILGVLVVTSLGIATVWKRWRLAGLVPLAVILGYNLTTAISLTSGGRYLVPMDWGVLLYFSIGLLEITLSLFALLGWYHASPSLEPDIRRVPKGNFKNTFMIAGLFLFIGSVPVILEVLPRTIYPVSVTMEDFIKADPSLPDLYSSSSGSKLASIENIPGVVIVHGKALYPRYYGQNKGEGPSIEQDPLVGSASFDHLSFLVIGGKNDVSVLFPATRSFSPQIPGSDTWVIGCQRKNYLEAILIIFRQDNFLKAYWQDTNIVSCQ